jgi:hypothetical protein
MEEGCEKDPHTKRKKTEAQRERWRGQLEIDKEGVGVDTAELLGDNKEDDIDAGISGDSHHLYNQWSLRTYG